MRILYTLAAALLAAALLAAAFPTPADAAVYDATLRLHVIAASDTTADQSAKLAARDAILAVTTPALAACTSRDEAETTLRRLIPTLAALAEEAASAPATVTLTREAYPTRSYAALALPAGEYLSMQVILGEGEGQNWWCVLFPPLCLDAATADRDACIEAGLTPEAYRLITAGERDTRWRVKFRILEWLGEIFG